MKQFLLNPDGSIPNGLTAERLVALGLTLVLPTERPASKPGFAVVEGVAADGRQTWD